MILILLCFLLSFPVVCMEEKNFDIPYYNNSGLSFSRLCDESLSMVGHIADAFKENIDAATRITLDGLDFSREEIDESLPLIDTGFVSRAKRLDNRILREDYKSYPFRCMLSIRSHFRINTAQGEKIVVIPGTATIFYKNVALTAAHNIYKSGYFAEKIECYTQMNGENDYKEKLSVYSCSFLSSFIQRPEIKDNDYAVLFFEKLIGEQYGWIYPIPFEKTSNIETALICGYPSSIYNKNTCEKEEVFSNFLYSHEGRIFRTESPNILKHEIHTTVGQSGASLIVQNDDWGLISIHVAGMSDKDEKKLCYDFVYEVCNHFDTNIFVISSNNKKIKFTLYTPPLTPRNCGSRNTKKSKVIKIDKAKFNEAIRNKINSREALTRQEKEEILKYLIDNSYYRTPRYPLSNKSVIITDEVFEHIQNMCCNMTREKNDEKYMTIKFTQ